MSPGRCHDRVPRRLVAVAAVLTLAACAAPGAGSSGPGAGSATASSTSPHPVASTVTSAPDEARSATADHPCGWRSTPPAAYRTVVWVWLENRSADQVLDHPSMPYLNGIAAACGVATGMHAVTHPSLPNYLAAVSGSTGGVSTDCGPRVCPQHRTTLFDQVTSAGGTWSTFAQGMPEPCGLVNAYPYAAKHNPAVYFPALRRACLARDLPLGTPASGPLAAALASSSGLGSFSLLVPGLCDDGHDCSNGTADDWLQEWLPRLFASPGYLRGDTVLVVTYDEGAGGHGGEDCVDSDDRSCRVVAVVAGASVPPGTRVTTSYSHSSLLRTTEELLGITAYLGEARTAASMRADFHL